MAKNWDDYLLKKFEAIETIHWWWEGRRALVKQLMVGKRYGKILDVGCGTGETLTFLGKLFPKSDLYAIDTSDVAIKYAKNRGHKNIFKASATKLPFKNNTFDAVLFLDVLEHIENDQKAIAEAKRVLKKNGVIVITAPALPFIWSGYDVNQGHQRRYTRRRLRMLANNAKMKVTFLSYFNFILSLPAIIIRKASNVGSLKSLASYDSKINLDIANFGVINSVLRAIFLVEIGMLKYLRYPLGISVAALIQKT